MQFNIMTSTFGLPFLRLTDALAIVFIPCLFVMVGPGNTVRFGLPYLATLSLVVVATLLLKTAVQVGDVYFTLILFLYGVLSFYFVMAAKNESMLVAFSIGTLAGLVPSAIVLFLQAGGDTSLYSIGLGVPPDEMAANSALLATVKLGGIWALGNESGHVYAIATAPALYLSIRYRRPLIYVVAYCVLLATFTDTLNRGGLVAPSIGLIYCYARLGNFFLYAKTALALVAVAVTATANFGLDPFYDVIERRFFTDEAATSNVAERLMSNLAGLQISIENPFGIGFHERISQMLHETTSVESVHNGFLSLAYQSGIVVPIVYVVSGVYLLIRRRAMPPLYMITFLFTASSMMFEELTYSQPFIFSVTLTIAAAWVEYIKRTRTTKTRSVPLGRKFTLNR